MRQLYDFHGGIHPPEHKTRSTALAISVAGYPEELVLPLSQHRGASAEALVSPGEQVLKGQLIAQATATISANIHAPTSGTITAIENRPVAHPSGMNAPCIVLSPDGSDQWIPRKPVANYQDQNPETLTARIRASGIVGLGGAGFPSDIKLAASVDTLIINGVECEPYITADDALMREQADTLLAGIAIVQHILSPRETVLAIEDNKPEAITACQTAMALPQHHSRAIELAIVPTKYPSGGENQLIEILTGTQIPSGTASAHCGIVCLNVGTCVAIAEAILHDTPLISRITTVTGDAITQAQNFRALIGTPVSFLLQQAGFNPSKNQRLIIGGPMMGFAVSNTNVPIEKTTNCILAPTEKELPLPPPAQACIRCGLCSEACPAQLLPQQLYWFARGHEHDKLEQHQLFDCIECGACSFVCPSHIPLVQYYRAAKAEILELKNDLQKADHAKARFEARQERLEREATAREEKRAARKKAAEANAKKAGNTAAENDPIAAAIARAKAKKAAKHTATNSDAEQERLENAVLSAKKRLATAEQKLAEAQQDNADNLDALQRGVDRTRERLVKHQQALTDYTATQQTNTKSDSESNHSTDAAQAAIAKAIERRAAQANLSPQEKLKADIEKFEQRLANAQAKLNAGEAEGEREKILVALRATVERLTNNIAKARQALSEIEQEKQ